MKYAVGVIIDQTYGYLTEEGSFTTQHPEAILFGTRYDAEQAAEKSDSMMPVLDINGNPYSPEHLEVMKCFIEPVENETEFHSREDTWS